MIASAESVERLNMVLERLAPLIVNDERAAEIERSNRHAAALMLRSERRERLERESVPVTRRMARALERDEFALRTTALRAVARWFTRQSPTFDIAPMLCLQGGAGSGKSVGAAWVFVRVSGAKWRSAVELMHIFSGYFGDDRAEQYMLRSCPLLVIDDVGRELEAESPRMGLVLTELLDYRKREGLLTLLTMNFSREQLGARYRLEPLHSRLRESCTFVTVPESDMRGSDER